MHNSRLSVLVPILAAAVLMSGCATTRPRRAEKVDPQAQVVDLQNQLQAKDQQIQDLQSQLAASSQPMPMSNFSSSGRSSSVIRVSGVSVTELQRALKKAGYDPGPVDGRVGKKTKSAIRRFQRDQGLASYGVVGDKTWTLLNR